MTAQPDSNKEAQVLALTKDFARWRTDNPVGVDGLDQMIGMIGRAVTQQEPLSQTLLTRLITGLVQLETSAQEIDNDLAKAVAYLRTMLHDRPGEIDDDAAFLYGMDFAHRAGVIYPEDAGVKGFAGRWNALVGDAATDRIVALYSVATNAPLTVEDQAALAAPLLKTILERTFPLPAYVDGMHFGQLAWGDGAQIAHQLWQELIDPGARGQSYALIPDDCPDAVEERYVHWVNQPFYRHWLTEGLSAGARFPGVTIN